MIFDKDTTRVEMPDGSLGPPTNEAQRQMETWLMLKELLTLLNPPFEFEEKRSDVG